VNCDVKKGQHEATIRSQLTLMLSVVANASKMHSLVPLWRHYSRSSCPHPMLKSLKLGELGIERDPFVLPSDWRSEVLRRSVRSMVDMQRSSVLARVERLQTSSAGVHGEVALLLSSGRSRECVQHSAKPISRISTGAAY